jgi:hypothetical protein
MRDRRLEKTGATVLNVKPPVYRLLAMAFYV